MAMPDHPESPARELTAEQIIGRNLLTASAALDNIASALNLLHRDVARVEAENLALRARNGDLCADVGMMRQKLALAEQTIGRLRSQPREHGELCKED